MDGVKIPYVDWFKMGEPQILQCFSFCVVSATNIGIYLLVL
ncbi:unnamed protein product [Brassica oleracea]